MAYTPDQFAAILLGAAAKAPGAARDVTEDSAKNLKSGARRNATVANPVHARSVASHINYDLQGTVLAPEADIGYDKRGQGHLGAILEYANGKAHNAPQRNLGRALDVEDPRYTKALADMAERIIE